MKEKEFEKILKALANRRRLRILQYLKKNKEAHVGELANAIHLSFKSTSRHLGVLFAMDIIEKDQRSSRVFYRLSSTLNPIIRHIISFV